MLRIVPIMRPNLWVEGVTLHVETTLFEKLLTEFRGFSLNTKFCGVVVCLSVRGTCGPEVVQTWSKFGSEFGFEIKLDWGSVLWYAEIFLVMVEVSESEIISSSSEVERILSGDLSNDLLSGVWSVSVFFTRGGF